VVAVKDEGAEGMSWLTMASPVFVQSKVTVHGSEPVQAADEPASNASAFEAGTPSKTTDRLAVNKSKIQKGMLHLAFFIQVLLSRRFLNQILIILRQNLIIVKSIESSHWKLQQVLRAWHSALYLTIWITGCSTGYSHSFEGMFLLERVLFLRFLNPFLTLK
jgi:hypothetical protein